MGDLTTRPYEPTDAAAITALLNTIDEQAGGRAGFTVEETSAMISAMVADPVTDSRLTVTDEGVLVAGGVVGTPPAGGYRVDIFGGVHPDWRGRGLGRELLGWQYHRAVEIHSSTDPGSQWQVETGVLVGEPTAPRLFDRLGFAPVRYFFEMVADTATASDAKLPEGLRSEQPTPQLDRPLYEAHMEAFADHWGYQRRDFEGWLPLALHSEGYRPDLSRVAVDGEEIAGYILSYRDNDPTRVYIGQVGTRRPWRGRGLASALMAEVIEAAATAGYPTVCLGVDADSPTGAVGVYERAGFTQEHSFVAYRRAIG